MGGGLAAQFCLNLGLDIDNDSDGRPLSPFVLPRCGLSTAGQSICHASDSTPLCRLSQTRRRSRETVFKGGSPCPFGRKSYGDEGYSRAEPVAELGSVFPCTDLEIASGTARRQRRLCRKTPLVHREASGISPTATRVTVTTTPSPPDP